MKPSDRIRIIVTENKWGYPNPTANCHCWSQAIMDYLDEQAEASTDKDREGAGG